MLSTLKSELVKSVIGSLFGGLVPPFLAYLAEKISWVNSFLSKNIAEHAQLFISYTSLLLALFVSIFMIAGLLFYVDRLKAKPYLRYGVLWDRRGNSYCPACEKPTAQLEWVAYNDQQWKGLKCACQPKPIVFMDKGQPMKGEEVMRLMAK